MRDLVNLKYQRGRAKEYRARQQLLKEGWSRVWRTAGSHGEVDLIAVNPPAIDGPEQKLLLPSRGRIKLVQVKGGKKQEYAKRKALEQIKLLAGTYEVEVEVR